MIEYSDFIKNYYLISENEEIVNRLILDKEIKTLSENNIEHCIGEIIRIMNDLKALKEYILKGTRKDMLMHTDWWIKFGNKVEVDIKDIKVEKDKEIKNKGKDKYEICNYICTYIILKYVILLRVWKDKEVEEAIKELDKCCFAVVPKEKDYTICENKRYIGVYAMKIRVKKGEERHCDYIVFCYASKVEEIIKYYIDSIIENGKIKIPVRIREDKIRKGIERIIKNINKVETRVEMKEKLMKGIEKIEIPKEVLVKKGIYPIYITNKIEKEENRWKLINTKIVEETLMKEEENKSACKHSYSSSLGRIFQEMMRVGRIIEIN